MGQLRVLKGGWGVMGQPPFEVGQVIEESVLPDSIREAVVLGGKAERVAVMAPAGAPKPAGGTS